MTRNRFCEELLPALTGLALLLCADAALAEAAVRPAAGVPEVVEPPDASPRGLLFDINVHTEEELELILRRVDALTRKGGAVRGGQPIALVLHGPEVAFFASRNYGRYRDLVDLAARLSAFEFIDMRMCRTRMRDLGIGEEEIPPFIEVVPFGPDESQRLRDEGYVVM